jgi:protein gp37
MTSIEWTHGAGYQGETWNPIVGCSKVSPGCAHCYAETTHRMRHDDRNGYPAFRPWTPANAAHNVTLRPERLQQPYHWRRPRMVFVCSMADLFHERVPYEFIRDVFNIMRCCDGLVRAADGYVYPSHVFQVLTKRPERMLELAESRALGFDPSSPPTNIWMGTSIENRHSVSRADLLRQVPAAVRFISAEPLLGPLVMLGDSWVGPDLSLDGIDWLIVGGESGGKHRPMHLDWVRDLRNYALSIGTTFFLKQLGGRRPGDKLEDLPEDLRIREFPRAREAVAA